MELVPLTLSGFKNVNDRTAPDLIGQDEATILQDVVLDYKIGKPIKRGQWSRFDTGVSATYDIDTIADIDINGTPSLLVAVNAGANSDIYIYNLAGHSWSGYISSLTAGAKFKIVPFADSYIFTFDTDDDPKQVDKTSGDVFNLELGVADVTTIKSYHDADGSLSTETLYKWMIVGLTEDGQLAPPSRPFTHFWDSARDTTTDDGTNSSRIYFRDLPYIADSRVVSRMLFRNKKVEKVSPQGEIYSGEVYYLVAILDNDSTGAEYQEEFIDDIADINLGTEIAIYLNMPTRAKYVAFSNERLFLGNFSQKDLNHVSLPSSNALFYDGTHTGSNNASTLTDSTQNWATNSLVGKTVYNITDGSSGLITANTGTTITATLAGGSQNDWDTGEYYYYGIAGLSTTAFGYNVVASNAHDTTTPGFLAASTQYDYRIHIEDKYGRLSKYYHELTTTTGGGASDYKVTLNGLGWIDIDTAKDYPKIAVYRRTGGTGSYYLIYKGFWGNTERIGRCAFNADGQFVDYGASNLTETWSDPNTNIKSYPSAITFSDISSPSSFRDENKRQVFFDDGDEITGLFDDQEGVVIFRENNIYKVYCNGAPENWRLVRLVKDYGCNQPTTIQKSGNSFYFIYNNKAYRYDYGAEKPVDIGILFQDTLDSMTEWHDSAINDEWYMVQCKTTTTYFTLVYDTKLNTWYKWKHTQSSSEDCKRLNIGKYGSLKNVIFGNADSYVTVYTPVTSSSSATRADTEIGSTRQITPIITSKVFKTDGISLVRFRKLKFDYTKVNDQNTSVIITDSDTGDTIILTDTTNSSSANSPKLYEAGIGTASDTLKQSRSFDISVQGAGLLEWDNLRLEGRQIHKGKQVSA